MDKRKLQRIAIWVTRVFLAIGGAGTIRLAAAKWYAAAYVAHLVCVFIAAIYGCVVAMMDSSKQGGGDGSG